MAKYYYIDANKTQHGPYTAEELRGVIGPATPVWSESMSDWAAAGSVDELAPLFARHTPPPAYGAGMHHAEPAPPKPDSWLVWAILSTVLCCPVFGIVAIIYAAKVDGLWLERRYDEAQAAAKTAKTWTIVGAVTGIVGSLIYFGLIMLGMVNGFIHY